MKRTRPDQTRRTRIAQRLYVAGDTLLVAGVLSGVWWWHLNHTPTVHIPTVVLPDDNGYDRLVRACEKMVHDDDVNYTVDALRGPRANLPQRTFTPEETVSLVSENAAALAELRQALLVPAKAHPSRHFSDTMPEFARFRQMARLLRLEGAVHEAKGEWASAASSYADAIELGNAVPNGGGLIHRLVGMACEAIGGRHQLIAVADHLSASETRDLARRLEEIDADRAPMADTLTEVKWGTESRLIDVYARRNVVGAYRELHEQSEPEAPGDEIAIDWKKEVSTGWSLLTTSKSGVLAANAAAFDSAIALSKRPYPEEMATEEPKPGHPLNQIFEPVFTQAIHKDADNRTQTAMVIAKLALRAYQQEQKSYPDSLEELVRHGYLKSVPLDAFAPGGPAPLRYRRDGETYLLYSVGPDSKDDGGKPMDNKYSDGKYKHWADRGHPGDFVLGINL